MSSTKISISLDKKQLRLARRAARDDGLTLSAYVSRALNKQIEDTGRVRAAHALYRSWGMDSTPTAEAVADVRRMMQRPIKRKKKAA